MVTVMHACDIHVGPYWVFINKHVKKTRFFFSIYNTQLWSHTIKTHIVQLFTR